MVVKIETPIGERLRLEMKKRGMSSAEIARLADVKTSFLYDVISGKSANPSTVKLGRVAAVLGVNLAYLAGGTEDPEPARAGGDEDYIVIPRLVVELTGGSGQLVSRRYEEERFRFRRQWIEDQLAVSPSDLRLLYVRGDSMEPTLCHNDIALVDMTKILPSPPGIFVIFDGFGLMAKRLEYASEENRGRIRIAADNPQYSSYERSAEETRAIGRVVWFSREI